MVLPISDRANDYFGVSGQLAACAVTPVSVVRAKLRQLCETCKSPHDYLCDMCSFCSLLYYENTSYLYASYSKFAEEYGEAAQSIK